MSVTTAMHRPIVTHPDTWRDRKETARRAAFPQPGGRFRRWWQVLGSNQRRLSRRFYSPSLLFESNAAPASAFAVRGGDPGQRRPLCARWHPFPEAMKPRTAAFTFTDGEGGSGYSDRLHTFLPLTWCFRISVHHRLRSQVLRLRHHQRPYRQADLFRGHRDGSHPGSGHSHRLGSRLRRAQLGGAVQSAGAVVERLGRTRRKDDSDET